MRISKRALIFSIVSGVILICGCAIVYLFGPKPLMAFAPPDGGEPVQAEPTAAPPSIVPTPVSVSTSQPAIPERRRLTLEFPPEIRAGDSERVRLTLEVDDLGKIIPTAETGGNVITGETIAILNLYESHHVIVEARLDMAGMEVSPPDLSSQTLAQGQSVTFYWSIRPAETGLYRGTAWLYLRFVDRQNGEESRKAVSAQLVEIEAVNLLGLSANLARATGVVGSVVGTIVGFPFFEDILKFLLERRKKRGK